MGVYNGRVACRTRNLLIFVVEKSRCRVSVFGNENKWKYQPFAPFHPLAIYYNIIIYDQMLIIKILRGMIKDCFMFSKITMYTTVQMALSNSIEIFVSEHSLRMYLRIGNMIIFLHISEIAKKNTAWRVFKSHSRINI